jgi:hypothetical protein
LITERMSVSRIRIVLIISLLTAVAFTVFCGNAVGQYYGLYPGAYGMPVTAAGPCGAIASAGGVTACADVTGAVASAGGIVAGASALFPTAFAGPVAPISPYYGPEVFI